MQHSIWAFSDSTVPVLTKGYSINFIAFNLCKHFQCVNILNVHVLCTYTLFSLITLGILVFHVYKLHVSVISVCTVL